jgi:hypothetical protein
MVSVGDPSRTGMDTNEGSTLCWGTTLFNEISNKVIDGHDDHGVVNLRDRGGAMAYVSNLLTQLFGSKIEVVVDRFGNQLEVEWGNGKSRGSGVNCVDFVTSMSDERVLL